MPTEPSTHTAPPPHTSYGTPEKGNRRRIDRLYAGRKLLTGEAGVVAATIVPRADVAFSYHNPHTRRDVHKQSDHDMIQLVLRTCKIRQPPWQPTIRPSTLRHTDVHAAIDASR